MNNVTLTLKHGSITRVGYLNAPIPAEFVGLDPDTVNTISWAEPTWASDGQILFGAATWIADIGDTRIAFDPVMAADAFLRASPEVAAEQQVAIKESLNAAGYPVESVDVVLLTHFDGVGAIGHVSGDGRWSPFFPNARILISRELMDNFCESAAPTEPNPEYDAFAELIAGGHFDTFEDGQEIRPGITADVSGQHAVGHTVFQLALAGADNTAAFIGHLAISPLHLVTGPNEGFHENADAASQLLSGLATSANTLIGPLWPAPGYGQWAEGQLIPGA